MVVYYPHCGTFRRALEKKKVFKDLFGLSVYLLPEFGENSVYFKYFCFDDRLKKHVFMVCVSSYMGENYLELYKCPQCVGYFYFDEEV